MIELVDGQERLRIVVPFMPPSSNHIYVTNWRRKIRFLSKEAQTFQKRVLEEIVGPNLADITRFVDDVGIYSVWYVFFFENDEIINKTFGQGKKSSAVDRYKKLDTDNRAKLLSDTFAKGIGVDDKRFFRVVLDKMSCSLVGDVPQAHIILMRADPAHHGV